MKDQDVPYAVVVMLYLQYCCPIQTTSKHSPQVLRRRASIVVSSLGQLFLEVAGIIYRRDYRSEIR